MSTIDVWYVLAMRMLAAGSAVVFTGLALAQFHSVGVPTGYSASRLYGLSADGQTAAGNLVGNLSAPGFTWTAAGGRDDFGLHSGMPPYTQTFAISGDASTVAGSAGHGGEAPRAFRYREGGAIEYLGDIFPGQSSYAYGMNHDGSIVVGYAVAGTGQAYRGFRWTQETGMQPIGTQFIESRVHGISRDGITLVGTGDYNAFTWTESGGVTLLPNAPGSDFGSYATAVNFDGSLVVGQSGPGGVRPTLWREGQPTLLPFPSGYRHSYFQAVSDDGRMIVGEFTPLSSVIGVAFVHTPDRGSEPLANYLAACGVGVPQGWSLINATAVSADGNTIGGWARSNGQTHGFVVTIPAPWTLSFMCAACVWGTRRRTYPHS